MNARALFTVAAVSLCAAAPAHADAVTPSAFAPLTGAGACIAQIGSEALGGCATGHGLQRATAVVVSGDQRNVYAVSSGTAMGEGSNAVVTFTRDAATGALTQTGCISDDGGDGRVGSDGLCTDGDALTGADAIALSPDDRNVYVASGFVGGIAVFARDPATGALTQTGCVKTYNDRDHCSQGTGLRGAAGVAVSPDGRNVYATARDADAVVTFARDPETGALTWLGCVSNSGNDGACDNASALDGAGGIALSPDGAQVYVSSYRVGGIVVFDRDADTGALAQKHCFLDIAPEGGPCTHLDGIAGASAMALAPDGKNLYLTAPLSNRLFTFARDTTTGALTPASCLVNALPEGDDAVTPPDTDDGDGDDSGDDDERRDASTCAGARALGGVSEVAVAADGGSVFAAGSGGLTAFARDATTGALQEVGCAESYLTYKSCATAPGAAGVRSLASSQDGRNLYTASGSQVSAFGATVAFTSAYAQVGARGTTRIGLACPAVRTAGCVGRLLVAGRAVSRYRVAAGARRTVRLRLPASVRHRARVTVRARDAHRVTRPAQRRIALRR